MSKPTTNFYRALALALLSLAVLFLKAQVVNEDDLRKIQVRGIDAPITALECLPDGRTIWAVCATADRILVIDTGTWSVQRTIPLTGFGRGVGLTASADGRYLLIKGKPPYAGPDDRKERRIVVMDAGTGRVLVDIPSAMDACLVPRRDAVAVLSGDSLTVRAFNGSAQGFKLPGAAWAIAVDPVGRNVVVSKRPTVADLRQVPVVRDDKGALRSALKYRNIVAVHALADGALVRVVPGIYDHVSGLRFTPDGTRLLVFSVPDTRSGMSGAGLVEAVDAAFWEPLRASFMSWTADPEMAVSPDGLTLALSSMEGRHKRKLMLYDLATGDTRLMVDLQQKRRYDKAEGEQHDGRLGYAWLMDGRLLIGQGAAFGCYAP